MTDSHGFTVADLADRYRVSPDKVRGWIVRAELRALNTAAIGCKPRYVVPPDALADFERARSAAKPVTAPRRRRRAATAERDFYGETFGRRN